ISTVLVGAFAAISLLLASIGLYGLLAYTIAQRQREMAVRIALGADGRRLIEMVLGQAARLVGVGLIVGLLAALALTRGRFFSADEYAQERRVVIVNEKLAARVWPGQDPVGKRLKWGGAGSAAPWLTVVGVIRNVADGPIDADPSVHAYEPFRQFPDYFLNGATNQFGRDLQIALRADGDPRALAPLVRQEIAKLISTVLVGAFAAISLLLASIGLYGLLAYTIAQRQREMAVRIALGADGPRLIEMVLGQAARLVGVGLIVGLLAALALTRLIASLLYRTNEYDLVTFTTVPAVLVAVAFVACVLPAWRAVRLDPIVALRAD
ncbi:MAG: FtsX-like permease family protein, partial [Acidobacteria bacterium]|nr:FtsX-like permease family protein [Acidobacteriota bacterium]